MFACGGTLSVDLISAMSQERQRRLSLGARIPDNNQRSLPGRFNIQEIDMPVRTSHAEWHGTLREGEGKMRFGGGAYEGSYTWSSRFEEAEGTNPEELIAAAHAGCFSMALSGDLVKAGFTPKTIKTTARVHIEKVDGAQTINQIELLTHAEVPDIDEATFQKVAEGAKAGCPVSRALKSVPRITLRATLTPARAAEARRA
jgi:osmotically inducible protein OsmC